VLRARKCAPTLSPFVVYTFGVAIESIEELGGASYGSEKTAPIMFFV
jgi:hypothetical protein